MLKLNRTQQSVKIQIVHYGSECYRYSNNIENINPNDSTDYLKYLTETTYS